MFSSPFYFGAVDANGAVIDDNVGEGGRSQAPDVSRLTSAVVETEVRAWLEKLNPALIRAGIAGGQVVIACKGERRHGQGLRHHVHMELNGSGRTIVIGHDPTEIHPHEDVYIAIRDAFRVLRRRLDQNAGA